MRDYDLTKPADKQAFEAWIVSVVRNEINSYVKQVLFDRNAAYVDTRDRKSTRLNSSHT